MPKRYEQEPHFPLKDIKALVRAPQGSRVGTGKAINPISERRQCTRSEAIRFARQAVLSLTADDFVGPTTLADGTPADEYGCWVEELGWYVKVTITAKYPGKNDTPEVDILSCHPPKHDLETRRGVIPEGGLPNDEGDEYGDEDEEGDHDEAGR